MKKNLKPDKYDYSETAENYDSVVKEYDSYGHDVLFGMTYDYVSADEKLLDIGIGTGLSSRHFARTGLKVYGLDESEEMLGACRSKSFTEELTRFDATSDTIPYGNRYFDHVICCGVLHFLGDLSDLFAEARRVMKTGGIFAFTISPSDTDKGYIKEPTAWGVPIFRHSPEYIMELLYENGLELVKEQRLLTKGADKISYNMLFSVMVTRCSDTTMQ